MITYYLSGPMRGLPEHNYPTFNAVEAALAAWLLGLIHGDGFEILNPARNFDGDQGRPTTEYMQKDMELVLRSDVVVLLPGWEKSEGADRETKLAEWTGKEFWLATDYGKGGGWRFHAQTGLPPRQLSPRADALTEAQALITGDRNNAYGPPTQDFRRTAGMATAFGFRVIRHDGAEPEDLKAHHVAIFMMMLKTARLAWTPTKRDSWVDNAGYAGCGYECAIEEVAS